MDAPALDERRLHLPVVALLGLSAAVALVASGFDDGPWRLAAFLAATAVAAAARRRTVALVLALAVPASIVVPLALGTFVGPAIAAASALLTVVNTLLVNRTLEEVTRVREALGDSHGRWQTIFQHHPEPFLVHDPLGRVLEANTAARNDLGWSDERLRQRTFQQLLPLEDVNYADVVARVLAGETVRWSSRTGSHGRVPRDLEGASMPVRTGGEVTGVLVSLKDVTELNRQRAEVLSVQLAMDRISNPVAVYDGQTNRYLYVNEQAAALLETTPDRLVGQPATSLGAIRELALAGQATHATVEAGGDVVTTEIAWPGSEGDAKLEVRFQRVQAHGSDLVVVVCHDVTNYATAIDEGRRTVAELRDVDEIKNAFLSAVSHELRTPLTVVRGMAATLARHAAVLDTEQVSDLAGRLDHQARRLDGLLSDLLDVDRLARGQITAAREWVELDKLTGEVLADHPDVRLHLQVERAFVDPVQLERIVVNLLSNARKYAGGADLLTVVASRHGGVVVSVSDRGPGIPDEDKAGIFEAFRRLDHDHPSPGTGIGLSMVHKFAELHGGRAWATDRVGGGAEIHVDLPGPDPAAAGAPSTEAGERPAPGEDGRDARVAVPATADGAAPA